MSINYSKFIRENLSFFTVVPFYAKDRSEVRADGTLDYIREWSLYEAKVKHDSQSIFIVDIDGFVRQKEKKFSIIPLRRDSVPRYFNTLPKSFQDKVKIQLEAWGYNVQKKNPADVLFKSKIFTTPVPRLINPKELEGLDWSQVVRDLTEYKGESPDTRIVLLRKCTTLRGVDQRLNAHAFISTQGNTGRSDYYNLAGDLRQKTTANTLLGFAKSPKEIFPGSVDGTELPQALDQLESQSCPQIFRYLFQIMETGEANVDTGAVSFPVRSMSVFIVISNPIGYSVDSTKSFWSLIEHLSPNPALGRRFGLIFFGTDYIELKVQLSQSDIDQWRDIFTFLRSVEEYARLKLRAIYRDPRVWKWANLPIKVDGKITYAEKGTSLIESVEDEGLRNFLTHHFKNAITHIRGAAISSAILDNLKDIAIDGGDVLKILRDAESYLKEITFTNLESVENLTKSYREVMGSLVKQAFDSLPKYLKIIVSAVELFRRENQDKPAPEIDVNLIDYSPNGSLGYTYLSVAEKDARKGNFAQHNQKLRRYFNFELIDRGGLLVAHYLDTKPVDRIELFGILGRKGILEDFSDKQSSQNTLVNEDEPATKPFQNSKNTPNSKSDTHTSENKDQSFNHVRGSGEFNTTISEQLLTPSDTQLEGLGTSGTPNITAREAMLRVLEVDVSLGIIRFKKEVEKLTGRPYGLEEKATLLEIKNEGVCDIGEESVTLTQFGKEHVKKLIESEKTRGLDTSNIPTEES